MNDPEKEIGKNIKEFLSSLSDKQLLSLEEIIKNTHDKEIVNRGGLTSVWDRETERKENEKDDYKEN